MNKRYIDLDSYYRDRKLYPNPAEFSVQLSPSGLSDNILQARNPTALAYPYHQWQWGCRQVAGGSVAGTAPSGIGLALGGTGPTFAGVANNTSITANNALGTPQQPQPTDSIRAGNAGLGTFISINYTKNDGFFNGLIYQNSVQVGGRPNSSRISGYESGPNVLGIGPAGPANPFGILNGIFTLQTPLTVLNTGDDMRLENNFIAGPPATAGLAPLPPAQVFVPQGGEADGLYIGDIYEVLMYVAGSVNPRCSQFRRIRAYDGETRIATLASGIVGWTSVANDITGVGVAGATYLHRLRRQIPLFPVDIGALAANIPLTLAGNQANAVYKLTILNAGTGYAIGVTGSTIPATPPQDVLLDILAVGPNGDITSFVIANPGTGLAVGQILTIVQGGANTCTMRVDGTGFGVNVLNVGSALGPPSQLTTVITERNRFTGQIFYIPSLGGIGTTVTDPSAAQQFIPQNNTRVSVDTPPAYTNDSTASSIILGDFVDVAASRFLVIQPFAQAFPAVGFEFNILQYHNDHVVPYDYTGSTVSQNQSVCYEITLQSITLPNTSISALGLGGKIAFYPYILVEFSNITAASSQNGTPVIYSNNPASKNALFKVAVTDTPTPTLSRFIKLSGDGTQTVKFKPNDNLKVRIILPNGETFKTVSSDNAPPLLPNLLLQISLTLGIERI